jgi:ParB/RepB/Spo0J family partition protein
MESLVKKKTSPPIITVMIGGLVEDPKNSNKMSEQDFELLVSNIQAHGFLQPILVQQVDGAIRIVDGHHRTRAAARAGLSAVPAMVWDGTEEMRKALSISMNKLRGDLDIAMVASTVAELHDAGWTTNDIAMIGYTESEIEDLLKISKTVTDDDVLEGTGGVDMSDDAPAEERPLVLELTFTTSEELKRAKRGLRRAAGKGRELGEGLLVLLDGDGA